MTDATFPRLRGTIWKRNAGVLRVWRTRTAVVTAAGFLLYKKKVNAIKTKEMDLVKVTFATTIAKANGYYYFELQYGSTRMAIGFPALQDTQLWLSGMMEAADENSAGRRAWMANLRRLLTLKLRDRRELMPAMADRDWFSEWNFCLRSLKDDREPVAARQRRLRRLYTIWLQFELFTEILGELFFSSIQRRDAQGLAKIESFERAATDYVRNGGEQRTMELPHIIEPKRALHSSLLSAVSTCSYATRNDVDKMKLAGIRLEFASKSWQGHKRLAKEIALFAKFRALIELFLSESTAENGKLPAALRTVLSTFPSFPLVAAFSIRGVSVMAIAEPLRSERSTLTTIDHRDLAGLTMALREANMLKHFPYQELPELVVRKLPGNVEPTLVKVHPRYNDVLVNSLRSPMIHGVLIRAGHGLGARTSRVNLLSAHDVVELVGTKKARWIPYLDLVYYQLDNEPAPVENLAVKAFLLMKTGHSTRQSLTGDIVIRADVGGGRMLLDLPEAFVLKHDVEIHPLVQKLQDVKKNSAICVAAASSLSLTRNQNERSRSVETSIQMAREYEDGVKKLFVQHIKEFAAQLVTLGDSPEVTDSRLGMTERPRAPTWSQTQRTSSRGGLTRSNTLSSMARTKDMLSSTLTPDLQRTMLEPRTQPRLRRRMSSLSSMAQTSGASRLIDSNSGTYVIDTLHLRQAMREGGVNVCFLPLVYMYLHERRQLGVQVLVASEIVARLAKNLFRYRMLNEETGKTSRWKSRKFRLMKFIDSIMHGLFHKSLFNGQCPIQECSGDQFWDIDGPILYSLGVFSSSFAMDPKAQNEVVNSPNSCLEKYRDILKGNPAVLFNCLLHVFQARLTKSILPELHENRFASMPFLQTEDDLTFNYEEDDPKLAMRIHPDLLWSYLQFFCVQFEALTPTLPIVNREDQVNKTKLGVQKEQTTWTRYYRALSRVFRHSLVHPQLTRLDKAIQSWQDLTAVRAHLGLALRAAAVCPYHSSGNAKATAMIREHCSFAYRQMASSKALFPIEYKFALRCLELVGTGEDLAKAMEESDELLEWLRFFYRPANPSQFAKASSSHPVYSIQYAANDTEMEGETQHDPMFSLRRRLQRLQSRQLWMSVMPNVDAYCRRIETMRRDPIAVAATRAVQCEMAVASCKPSNPCSDLDNASNDTDTSANSDVSWAKRVQAPFSSNPEESAMPSSMSSSRGDALWFIECFFLPPFANNSLLVAGDALVNNEEIASRMTSVCADFMDMGSVPGLALAWGNPLGLSLDEEAIGTQEATMPLRPTKEDALTISMVTFSPLRRVVQIACGYRHSALVTDDRHLYTFGHGECGRLGHGTEEACMEPRAVGYFTSLIAAEGVEIGGIADVSCGREHTMVVTASGDLFGFGWGEAGRLGTGETGSCLYPARVTDLKNIAAVACGREHTLALTRKGQVFAFGAGFGGRLGNGSERDEEQPFAVSGMEGFRIAAIDAGEGHSCALSNEGDIFTWGFGSSGALGHGNRDNCLSPRLLEGPWTRDSIVEHDRENSTSERSVITSIACGSYHTLAATNNGWLYGWGDAAAGQLGVEYTSVQDLVVLSPAKLRLPPNSGIRSVACGTFTSAVCTTQGHLFLWGSPAAGNGRLLDMEDARIEKIEALNEFEFAQIACGAYHAVAITQKLAYC